MRLEVFLMTSVAAVTLGRPLHRVPFGGIDDLSLDDFLSFLSSPKDTNSPPCSISKSTQVNDKYELRSFLRTHSHHTKVKTCGIRWKCENEFLCPFCTSKRLRTDRDSIADVLRFAPSSEFATLTIGHVSSDPLVQLWDQLTEAWRLTVKGKSWDSFRRRHQVAGYVRSFDLTWSAEDGWHPHFHLAFHFSFSRSETELATFRAELKSRWLASVISAGAEADWSSQDSSSVLNPDAVAGYLTNGGPFKRSDQDSPTFTPGDLLHAAVDGDLRARQLWHEHERASLHRRAVVLAGSFSGADRLPQRRAVSTVHFE